MNQDKLGIQGFRFSNENNLEIWLKPLANNEWALTFVNMKEVPTILNFDWYIHQIECLNVSSSDCNLQKG